MRLSRHVAGKQGSASSVLFDVPAEWVIAQGRLYLCALSLVAIYFDPPQPAELASASRMLLIGYFVYAVGLVAATHWRLPDPTSQLGIHAADVIVTSLLMFLADGPTSAFLAFFTFILLAATLRWKWRGALVTLAILLVVLAAVTLVYGSAAPQVTGHGLMYTIIRGAYLAVMGGMLAYVGAYRESSRERLARLAEWPAYEMREKDLPAFASTLAHATDVLGAPRVLAVWEETEEPFVKIASWQEGVYEQSEEPAGTFSDLVPLALAKSTFATANAASDLAVLPTGHTRIKAPLVNLGLLSRYQIMGTASAPFAGSICRGRVFVLDRTDWNEDQLLLTEIIAARLGVELDREALQVQAEDTAAIRERMRLARDLHDGVLQSLTAAGLQLKLSSGGLDEEGRLRLDTVKQLLANEQRRIREFVDETRLTKTLSGEVALNQDLRRVLTEAARTWNCALSFAVEPDDMIVSRRIVAQLSLMLAEAIANAVRHGNASQVKVAVRKVEDGLTIQVRDNGQGFGRGPTNDVRSESSTVETRPASLRERVGELGGSLEVLSASTGAELRIRVPLS